MAKYTVSVVRTAYAVRELEVEAASEKEARDKALEDAGNYLFSEHAAEYSTEEVVEHE